MVMATDHHHDSYDRVPVGLRFRPTQQELIYLLQLKGQGVDISTLTTSVLEKNLYGYGDDDDKEPWRVFSDVDDQHWEAYDDFGKSDPKKRVLYVITKLSKMSAKKTSRTAGRGTWDGQTKPKPVKNYGDDDQDIGYMKSLTYIMDPGFESEAEANSYYYMHEYSLCDFSLRQAGIASTDYVICRIVKDDSKRCNVGKKVKKAKNNVTRAEKEPPATLKIHGQEWQEHRVHAEFASIHEDYRMQDSQQHRNHGWSVPQQQQEQQIYPELPPMQEDYCIIDSQEHQNYGWIVSQQEEEQQIYSEVALIQEDYRVQDYSGMDPQEHQNHGSAIPQQQQEGEQQMNYGVPIVQEDSVIEIDWDDVSMDSIFAQLPQEHLQNNEAEEAGGSNNNEAVEEVDPLRREFFRLYQVKPNLIC